ncbi:hypothetical protein [Rhodoferax sp. UBA5149]|uniref:hypothetical protein n=1 Tax=Rhodoferax sp. UBA5149 TaxID=1947379 RepID=UPI0025E304FC|nr:hypothetical protein [Rhodoferax sp. UBA5149]
METSNFPSNFPGRSDAAAGSAGDMAGHVGVAAVPVLDATSQWPSQPALEYCCAC